MRSHAALLTPTMLMLGGQLRHFWEPPSIRSTFHSSMCTGAPPSPATVST